MTREPSSYTAAWLGHPRVLIWLLDGCCTEIGRDGTYPARRLAKADRAILSGDRGLDFGNSGARILVTLRLCHPSARCFDCTQLVQALATIPVVDRVVLQERDVQRTRLGYPVREAVKGGSREDDLCMRKFGSTNSFRKQRPAHDTTTQVCGLTSPYGHHGNACAIACSHPPPLLAAIVSH